MLGRGATSDVVNLARASCAAGLVQAGRPPEGNWITTARRHDNWNRASGPRSRLCGAGCICDDYGGRNADQLQGKCGQRMVTSLREAEINYDRLALDITEVTNRFAKGDQRSCSFIGGGRENTHSPAPYLIAVRVRQVAMLLPHHQSLR